MYVEEKNALVVNYSLKVKLCKLYCHVAREVKRMNKDIARELHNLGWMCGWCKILKNLPLGPEAGEVAEGAGCCCTPARQKNHILNVPGTALSCVCS